MACQKETNSTLMLGDAEGPSAAEPLEPKPTPPDQFRPMHVHHTSAEGCEAPDASPQLLLCDAGLVLVECVYEQKPKGSSRKSVTKLAHMPVPADAAMALKVYLCEGTAPAAQIVFRATFQPMLLVLQGKKFAATKSRQRVARAEMLELRSLDCRVVEDAWPPAVSVEISAPSVQAWEEHTLALHAKRASDAKKAYQAAVKKIMTADPEGTSFKNIVMNPTIFKEQSRAHDRYCDMLRLLCAAHAETYGGSDVPNPNLFAKCESYFENKSTPFWGTDGKATRAAFSKNLHGWFISKRSLRKGKPFSPTLTPSVDPSVDQSIHPSIGSFHEFSSSC